MESTRGVVKMPSLAKKSMNFLRDAYNMASHSGSSSPPNLGAHNQTSFQPSQGLSHHFSQSSQQQQHLRPNMHLHSNSWSGPQSHSAPNLGTSSHSSAPSPVSPPMKPSTQWPSQATTNSSATPWLPPHPPYDAMPSDGPDPPGRNSMQHPHTNQQQRQEPMPVQVFSPDDYHEIWQSESVHNVPKPPQTTTFSATSGPPHQQYQAPTPPINDSSTGQPQYPPYSPAAQQYQATLLPLQQQPVHEPARQQYQLNSAIPQQYPFLSQQQPYASPQDSQQGFQPPAYPQHSYSYPTPQQHHPPSQQQEQQYTPLDSLPSVYAAQGYYRPYATTSQPVYGSCQTPAPQQQTHHSQTWPQVKQEHQAQPPASQSWSPCQHQYQEQSAQADPGYFSYHRPPPQTTTSPVPSVAVSPPVAEMPTPSPVQAYHLQQQRHQRPQNAQLSHSEWAENPQSQHQHHHEYYGQQRQQRQYNGYTSQPTYQHQPQQYQAYHGNDNSPTPLESKSSITTSQIQVPAVAELPG